MFYYLTGEYDHQIDAKNRIRIPNKLKGDEKKLYFAKGTSGCIAVFYEAAMKENLEQMESNIKEGDNEKQRMLRSYMKSIKLVEFDGQGRLIVPGELKAFAKINKDIKICGAGRRIEIWAKEVYDEYFADEDENFDANFSLLDI